MYPEAIAWWAPLGAGPRNLPMPQAACVDWPKIATASFYLSLLPLFPPARDVTSQLQSDWVSYKEYLPCLHGQAPVLLQKKSCVGLKPTNSNSILLYSQWSVSSYCVYFLFLWVLKVRGKVIDSSIGAHGKTSHLLGGLELLLWEDQSHSKLWNLWAVQLDN